MHVRISPLLPIAFLVIWAITCVCTFLFATTSVVLDFAYFVLPFSAWVAPLCFAQLTCLLVSSNKNSPPARKPAVVLSVATFALAAAAYELSIVVIARFLELPWRLGKFGESSLSLGKSAACVFAIVTVLLVLSAIALFRAAPAGSRCARYAVGSLGMLVSASLIYLLFGLSPLVLWRA